MKTCKDCKELKQFNEFWKNSNYKIGLQPYCKPCSRQRRRLWVLANHDKARASEKRWKIANPDKVKIYRSREYARHKQAYKERAKKWKRANPDKVLDCTRAYQARKLSNFVERVERTKVYERDNGICGICEQFIELADFSVDHVIPLVLGGHHSYVNVQAAHLLCNSKKGSKILDLNSVK